MEWAYGEYGISNDKSLFSVDRIHNLLSSSLRGSKRSRENIRVAMEHSICYGVFHGPRQIGFARVVTDAATVYWLCDVFVEEGHRRRQLGKKLVECVLETPELKGLLGILATNEAHGLYEKYGFTRDSRQFMMRGWASGA
jgi:GNAT superfamily N-acetyltransferase